MFPFSKKKKEEEEEYDEKDTLEDELSVKKKIRDLKPENKKKRKEPIKPWGKSERILVFSVLILTVAVSAILSIVSKENLLLPNFSGTGFHQKSSFSFDNLFSGTFTFEKEDSGKCCQVAVNRFRNLTDDLTGEYGFYVARLDGSAEYGLNEDQNFTAASLMKVSIATILYKESEEGLINLDEYYSLQDSDKSGGNGSLLASPEGKQYTYRQLIKYMLDESDNTAYNILKRMLGDRKIQDGLTAIGMKNTSIYDDVTTPRDIASLFKFIKSGETLTRSDSNELLSYLENTSFNSWLVAGVPKETTVEHKYGREIGVVSDAGIVYSTKPYIVVILSKDVDEMEADQMFPQISKMIYEFEKSK